MKLLVVPFLLFFSVYVQAEVGELFPNNDAVLVIQGKDMDASMLFDAMKVEPLQNGNVLTKHISYETMYARPVFDLTCNKSQLTGNASCTLKFFSPESVINKNQKSILMGINDPFDAPTVAKMFNQISSDPHQGEVFRSANGKLRIWKTFNSSGEIVSFTMSYY